MIDQEKVYYPGIWDLFHWGHVSALRIASNEGTHYLIAGVPTDIVVEEDKGEKPVFQDWERVIILQSVKYVDQILIYHKLSFLDQLVLLKPDYLAVGPTWGTDTRHKEAEEWIVNNGKGLLFIPYTNQISTSLIKKRILDERARSPS